MRNVHRYGSVCKPPQSTVRTVFDGYLQSTIQSKPSIRGRNLIVLGEMQSSGLGVVIPHDIGIPKMGGVASPRAKRTLAHQPITWERGQAFRNELRLRDFGHIGREKGVGLIRDLDERFHFLQRGSRVAVDAFFHLRSSPFVPSPLPHTESHCLGDQHFEADHAGGNYSLSSHILIRALPPRAHRWGDHPPRFWLAMACSKLGTQLQLRAPQNVSFATDIHTQPAVSSCLVSATRCTTRGLWPRLHAVCHT